VSKQFGLEGNKRGLILADDCPRHPTGGVSDTLVYNFTSTRFPYDSEGRYDYIQHKRFVQLLNTLLTNI